MKKIFSFLLPFLLISSVYSQSELSKVRINLFHTGQHSAALSDVIDPTSGELMQNVVIDKHGKLTKRKGQSLHANDLGNTAFTGIGRYDPDATSSYLMAASGTSIIKSGTTGDWSVVNTGAAMSSGYDTEFIQADDLLFILNGQDRSPWYNNAKFTANPAGSTSPPTATTAAWLRNYLFTSGNPTESDTVRFSNNLEPLIFDTTDLFRVNTGDGQPVQRIEAFRLNELVIYKTRSIYVLDITGSTPLTDWTIQPISRVIGLEAERSVVNVGNDHWFLSSDPIAVRSLIRTSYDKILIDMASAPIQDIFDGTADTVINVAQAHKSCAVLYDNKYILAIPTGASTVNNFVVVYDFLTKGWHTIDGWYPAAWQVWDNGLYYIDANDGVAIECFDGTTGDFGEGPGSYVSASDPTIGISYVYISKNIDFDNPENWKSLDSLEVAFGTTGAYDASIFINIDDEGWTDIGDIDLSGDVVTLPVTLPFTLNAAGVARKTFQLQEYGNFKKIKVKIEQDGVGELCDLYSFTVFARVRPWRREL